MLFIGKQDSLLQKSFSLWKTVAKEGPKVIMETIKDPRKQVSNLQDQISHLGEDLMGKVPIDEWSYASKSDFHSIKEAISKMTDEMKNLNAKVEALSKPTKTSRASKTTKTTRASKKK
jgi:ferritin